MIVVFYNVLQVVTGGLIIYRGFVILDDGGVYPTAFFSCILGYGLPRRILHVSLYN
jgi:hypothetical protein